MYLQIVKALHTIRQYGQNSPYFGELSIMVLPRIANPFHILYVVQVRVLYSPPLRFMVPRSRVSTTERKYFRGCAVLIIPFRRKLAAVVKWSQMNSHNNILQVQFSWLEHRPFKAGVVGSNPATCTAALLVCSKRANPPSYAPELRATDYTSRTKKQQRTSALPCCTRQKYFAVSFWLSRGSYRNVTELAQVSDLKSEF